MKTDLITNKERKLTQQVNELKQLLNLAEVDYEHFIIRLQEYKKKQESIDKYYSNKRQGIKHCWRG